MATPRYPVFTDRSRQTVGAQAEQGQEALRSLITQLRKRIKDVECENESKTKQNEILRRQLNSERKMQGKRSTSPVIVQSSPENNSSKAHDPKKVDSSSHGLNGPSTEVEITKEARIDPEIKAPFESVLPDYLADKLPDDIDVQKKFKDLASTYGKKLVQVGELLQRESKQDLRITHLKATHQKVISFFAILQMIFHEQKEREDNIPLWLISILESAGLGGQASRIGQIWRLLIWSLHHDVSERDPWSTTQDDVDKWYSTRDTEDLRYENGPKKALNDLYASMCSDFGVDIQNKNDDLRRSILDESMVLPEVSSHDSSLSSKIPPQELWKFRSIIQGLVEKFEELKRHRCEASQGAGGVAEIDSEMYLPEKAALETYDIGNLLLTMNAAFERLIQEIYLGNENEQICQRCGLLIKNDSERESTSSQQKALAGQFMSLASKGMFLQKSSGLQSKESHLLVPDDNNCALYENALQPNPAMTSSAAGAIPKLAVRPMFQGIRGLLPPRHLTIVQNSIHRTRSDSSSHPEVSYLQRRELKDDMGNVKSSSLDSVFPSRGSQIQTDQSVCGVVDSNQFKGSNQSLSNSDDEYEVCGPPDTPPEVRAMEGLRRTKTEYLDPTKMVGTTSHIHQNSGDSGVHIISPEYKPGSSPLSAPHGEGNSRTKQVLYSQVRQCTGDNMSTRNDMLLPSSVEWSTLQLKDGGIPSPTLEDMNPYSSSMRLAEKSVLNRRCAVCDIRFSSSHSTSAIYDHIQGHIARSPVDSLVTKEQTHRGGKVIPTPHIPSLPNGDRSCPVCKVNFPDYVPLQAMETHINLHFDDIRDDFEVVNENFDSQKE